MIISPKIRGFICTTAHPDGCEAHVRQQVEYVQKQPPFLDQDEFEFIEIFDDKKRIFKINFKKNYIDNVHHILNQMI